MNSEQLIERLQGLWPEARVMQGKQVPEMWVAPHDLSETLKTMKNTSDLNFDFMFNLMGIDLDGQLGVYYHLESYALRHSMVLKCFAEGRDNAHLPSTVSLYPGAELLEREVFELYGIVFDGHPDLRKLLLPDDWVGFPLRKDYFDPVNIVER